MLASLLNACAAIHIFVTIHLSLLLSAKVKLPTRYLKSFTSFLLIVVFFALCVFGLNLVLVRYIMRPTENKNF